MFYARLRLGSPGYRSPRSLADYCLPLVVLEVARGGQAPQGSWHQVAPLPFFLSCFYAPFTVHSARAGPAALMLVSTMGCLLVAGERAAPRSTANPRLWCGIVP